MSSSSINSDFKIKIPAKNSENNNVSTRSLVRLESNGIILDNSIPSNEQSKTNIDVTLETVFHDPIFYETSKLPKVNQKLQDGKITTNEYNTELNNLKDRLAEIVRKMNIIRETIKAQDKNIDNQLINYSITIKNIEDNIEETEQDNKNNLQKQLIIKSKSQANEYDIYGI